MSRQKVAGSSPVVPAIQNKDLADFHETNGRAKGHVRHNHSI